MKSVTKWYAITKEMEDISVTVIQKGDVLKTILAAIGKIFWTNGDMLYGTPTLVRLSSKGDVVPGINAIAERKFFRKAADRYFGYESWSWKRYY